MKKQLAIALERARNYRDATDALARARREGERFGRQAPRPRGAFADRDLCGACDRKLEPQVPRSPPSSRAAAVTPSDVEAGRMLAEVQLHLRRLPDAEATLRRVIELAPGDGDSYLALERVYVQENKLDQAIAALEKLVAVEPKRARELYQRMAQYALQIYKYDDAIRYAQRAVELNPDDAEGHRRLAELYRSWQDTEHAIKEFRAAIQKNERLYAGLRRARRAASLARRLSRRPIASTGASSAGRPTRSSIARAARLSMQINLGNGTLESARAGPTAARDRQPAAADLPSDLLVRSTGTSRSVSSNGEACGSEGTPPRGSSSGARTSAMPRRLARRSRGSGRAR